MTRPKQGTSRDLFQGISQSLVRLGIYFFENAEMSYGWEFISLKRPKYGTLGDLFYRTGQNEVQLGTVFS